MDGPLHRLAIAPRAARRCRARTCLLAGAVVLAALGAAPAEAAGRAVPHGFYGVIWASEDAPTDAQDQAWDKLAAGGVESVRAVFNWNLAQQERDGAIRWQRTDRVVAAAAARRMSVMPTVMYVPRWAKQYPEISQSPPLDGSGFAAYGRFMGELVKRYGPGGSFWAEHPELAPRPIRHWQIWNEPHLSDHWWRESKSWVSKEAGRYGALVRTAYRAVRAVDKGGRIVLAGLTNDSWNKLAEAYRHAGVRGYFHVAALHMFPSKWRDTAVIVRRFRRALDARGGAKVPIWVTEMTWPASKGRASVPPWADTPYYRNFITTEKGAAARLKSAYRLLGQRSFRTRNRLQRVTWFTALSTYRDDYLWNYCGLLDQSGVRETPAYTAFRASARRDQGCTKDARGACRSRR
ncbi:MAG: hypothetical protein M3340_17965 [Actinomycetota bacterium]|nr:hypothetical protein [Actinomycetota bacterium]